MIVEKYIITGIKHPTLCVTDILRQNNYGNNLIDSVSVVRDNINKIFIDDFGGVFNTKEKAIKKIRRNSF